MMRIYLAGKCDKRKWDLVNGIDGIEFVSSDGTRHSEHGQGGISVHHNDYSRLGAEMPTDLVVLCRECHAKHHDKQT